MRRLLGRRSLVVGLVAGAVLVASLLPLGPGTGSEGSLPVADKLLHGFGYAVLALSACWARRVVSMRIAVAVVAAVALYGGVVELLQFPLATRHASLADARANAAGAVVGAGCWHLYRRASASRAGRTRGATAGGDEGG